MKVILFFGAHLKFFIFLFLSTFIYAEIIKMEDGQCYERKGKINYIAPCPVIKKVDLQKEQMNASAENSGKCHLKIEGYSAEFLSLKEGSDDTISCGDSQEYFNTMSIGYDQSLKKNKVKIGDVIVKKGLSKCMIELYYGDFMTVGLMSGDRLMCDDFMVHHSTINSRSRRRY